MRKTKIVCTIGPASSSEEVLKKMIEAGMNVARLNFSHGTHEQHRKVIETIKKVREEMDAPIAILLDTKGPEYRIKTFEKGKITLCDGDVFTFTSKEVVGNEKRVSVSYKGISSELEVGDRILLNNGLMVFEVTGVNEDDVVCKVITGGVLSDRKSMSFPGKVLNQVYLSEQDKKDLLFGIENDVDFIACSFVSNRQDIVDVKNFLKENGCDNIELIAKIENRAGVDNIKEICDECSGIMIGRGDMGVEIPFEELPAIQKHLISTCRMWGKRVITATEMLESMINNPRPTRAEISDVANAVYDGTSAIMLSGETAMGKYPIETVKTMSKIAEETERNIDYGNNFYDNYADFKIRNILDAISHSVCGMAIDINAKLIVACTRSGITARMVSRFRSPIPIVGMTTDEKAWRRLALSWGVIPMKSEEFNSTDVLFYHAVVAAKRSGYVQTGDRIVVTGGETSGNVGNTNLIKFETIK